MDMNIQNERNLHIMQEISKDQIFVLHGNELYVLIVSGVEKRLSLVGMLAGGVRQHEPIGAEVRVKTIYAFFTINYITLYTV